MRKLASIQKIIQLEPIPEADAILKATVLGWQLVVKKGEFEVGDLCVYCEIDCLMPNTPEFEFLKPRGMRIRTIRLRGQISQGICFPLSILPEGTEIEEDKDVTEILGITKYEPPIPAHLEGHVKGMFPAFIPKTDETRVQILQKLLDQYQGQTCFITEKLDGSSVTYYVKNKQFGVCSRNLELEREEENTLWKFAIDNDLETKMLSLEGNFAIQGEMIGEGIQGNKYKLRGQIAYFFSVFDIDKYDYLSFDEFKNFIEALALQTVPILATDYVLSNDIPTLVQLAEGKSVLYSVDREGIVIRPLLEQRHRILGRVSFKSINPVFLLKYE